MGLKKNMFLDIKNINKMLRILSIFVQSFKNFGNIHNLNSNMKKFLEPFANLLFSQKVVSKEFTIKYIILIVLDSSKYIFMALAHKKFLQKFFIIYFLLYTISHHILRLSIFFKCLNI